MCKDKIISKKLISIKTTTVIQQMSLNKITLLPGKIYSNILKRGQHRSDPFLIKFIHTIHPHEIKEEKQIKIKKIRKPPSYKDRIISNTNKTFTIKRHDQN